LDELSAQPILQAMISTQSGLSYDEAKQTLSLMLGKMKHCML
jgi:hypothetical protein